MLPPLVLLAISITYPSLANVASLPTTLAGHAGFWITKAGPISDDLLGSQVLVVKDEEVAGASNECKAKGADVRYSDKRYLMCAGSILTSRYILTSASCIHEATHIRHNIRAPLAAMIAPFSDTAQVIKISDYNIHPDHAVDPRNEDHGLHNVAIVKLACRILKINLKEVKLPVEPFADLCAEESCVVAIIKKTGLSSFTLYETHAKNVVDARDKRELTEITDEIKESSEKVIFNLDGVGKVFDSNKNKSAIQVIEVVEKPNNESSKNINKVYSKVVRSIVSHGTDKSGYSLSKNSVSENDKPKKISVRASAGINGCAQTGSPVMTGKIQSGMVAMSCDDRQLETAWQYTDVLDNRDWINEMIGNWRSGNQTRSGPSLGSCSTCIYNFFIDYNCKDKGTCRGDSPSGSNLDDAKIPGIELPKCTRNHTVSAEPHTHSLRKSLVKNKSKPNASQSLNQAYVNAVNEMYLNKRQKNDDTDDSDGNQMSKSSLQTDTHANEKMEKNDTKLPEHHDVLGVAGPPQWFLSEASEVRAPEESHATPWDRERYGVPKRPANSDFNEYFSDLKDNHREGRTNNEARQNKKSNLEDFFRDNKYDQSGIPEEYAALYAKFLEEHKQTRNKKMIKTL